ncbi:MAG: hypothetical protein V3574_00955 [Candidatus Moraniibacteriota bacterium]
MEICPVKKPWSVFPALKDSCLKNFSLYKENFTPIDSDPESFCSFIKKNLLSDWELVNEISHRQVPYMVNPAIRHLLPKTVIVIAKHYDKRGGASLVDAFQVFVWIEGRGVGVTEIFETELHHSPRPDNEILDLSFAPNITGLTENFIVLELRAHCFIWDWHFSKEFLFHWGK